MKTFFAENSIKISNFLLAKYNGKLSYSQFNKLLRKRDIKVDGVRISEDIKLKGNEKIEVYFDGQEFRPDYRIIYEDANILVLYKPKKITSEDFYNYLKDKYIDLMFCHRLDRNTDGIMLFAKNTASYEEILKGFKNRNFEKIYVAEVWGTFKAKRGTLTHYLYKDSISSTVTIYDREKKGTKIIKSSYIVLKETDITSLIAVKLMTGRTHQIRAQFAHIGHFVLGDGKYGKEKLYNNLKIDELKLTSARLKLNFKEGERLGYLNGKTFTLENYEILNNLNFSF